MMEEEDIEKREMNLKQFMVDGNSLFLGKSIIRMAEKVCNCKVHQSHSLSLLPYPII